MPWEFLVAAVVALIISLMIPRMSGSDQWMDVDVNDDGPWIMDHFQWMLVVIVAVVDE